MNGTPSFVSDVMTRTVVAVRRGATFKDIAKAMDRWNVSALPVVDDENKVIGVVSEADLLRKEEFRESDPGPSVPPTELAALTKADARTAEQLMTTPAVTAGEHDTLARAARSMAHRGVKRLPVVDGGGVLKGIVSRSDLLKGFLRDDESIAEEVRHEVVARLFPEAEDAIRVEVHEGVVRITGRVRDTTVVPLVTWLTRAVEGVVGVDCELLGPPRRPVLDPDPLDDTALIRPPGVVEPR
ncbi:CBS domain-containing protein [Streptomyces ferrugineus]|uniref:CBS domain-containing protein n=1 Tax=Streptomyces ferrugineus TaxID=1413221 RepID=A0A7M2SBJ7_9ACTN|nr:CBS domain-containing protein [Streptomyces ferrugineus]QOV33730.1 CBS domain-containing protein [Streptomyces ferrugineus]